VSFAKSLTAFLNVKTLLVFENNGAVNPPPGFVSEVKIKLSSKETLISVIFALDPPSVIFTDKLINVEISS